MVKLNMQLQTSRKDSNKAKAWSTQTLAPICMTNLDLQIVLVLFLN